MPKHYWYFRLNAAILLLAFNALEAAESSPPAHYSAIRSTVDTREKWTVFQNGKTGVSFSYPQSWHAEADKDAVAKFQGTADGGFAEVKLCMHESMKDPAAVANLMLIMLGQLPEFKKISSQQIRFGDRLQYTGREELVSFKFGENPMYNRLVFFQAGANIESLSFLSPARNYQQSLANFDRILNSVHAANYTNKVSNTVSSSGQRDWKLLPYTAKTGKIKISYPDGWQIRNTDPGKELEIKFTGKNADGIAGELSLSGGQRPPNLSLDQFETNYEETYLQPLKDFRKLSTRNASIGLNDGIIQECSFTVDGQQAKQWAAFFVDAGHFYCVALTAMNWKDADARNLFEHVLASVKTSE